MEEKKNVLTELRDGVLIVTLNREEKRNAIDPDTANELEAIFNNAEKDPGVGAILITGAGERSFCAGEDWTKTASASPRRSTASRASPSGCAPSPSCAPAMARRWPGAWRSPWPAT